MHSATWRSIFTAKNSNYSLSAVHRLKTCELFYWMAFGWPPSVYAISCCDFSCRNSHWFFMKIFRCTLSTRPCCQPWLFWLRRHTWNFALCFASQSNHAWRTWCRGWARKQRAACVCSIHNSERNAIDRRQAHHQNKREKINLKTERSIKPN